MTTLENTKPKSAEINSTNDATRCQHRRPSGRRCKLDVTAPGAPFCFTHTQEFNKADSLNLKTALLTRCQGFQTAQGINNSLSNLYILLANNYRPPAAPPFSPISTASSSAPSPPSTPTTSPASPTPPPRKKSLPIFLPQPMLHLLPHPQPEWTPAGPPNPTPPKNRHDHGHQPKSHDS